MKMDIVDISKELYQGSLRLENSSKEIFKLAKAMAETERDYRIELAKEKMKLRDEGMAVGLIEDVSRGNLAELRFERDLSKERYITGRDSIRAQIAQLNAL
ncbi:MAG TPA: hypothetical protein VFC79_03355 [Tissierellaceae bacterium]|nr:hypothetical protein [Tissierellaceae bacterium]